MTPPAVIGLVIRPGRLILEIKVVAIRTVAVNVGAGLISLRIFVDALAVEPLIKRAAVVEHAVQNDLHAAAMRLLHDLRKQLVAGLKIRLVRHAVNISGRLAILALALGKKLPVVRNDLAKVRIDIIIVLNVIFVIGRRNKEGIEVDHLDAKVLQIIHLVDHALQVTAVELTHVHGGRILIPILDLVHRLVNIRIFIRQHVIGRIAVVKAVHEDLIHDGALGPVRRAKTGNDGDVIIFIRLVRKAAHVVICHERARADFEMIGQLLVLKLDLTGVIIKIVNRLHLGHGDLLALGHEVYDIDVVPCGPEFDRHLIIAHGLRGSHVMLRRV